MTCWLCKKANKADDGTLLHRLCDECRAKLQGKVTDGEPLVSVPPTTTEPATRPENEQ